MKRPPSISRLTARRDRGAGRRITARHIRELEKAGSDEPRSARLIMFIGKILAHDIVDTETGELLAPGQ